MTEQFGNLIRSMLSMEADGDSVRIVEVMPGKKVAIKSEMLTNENKTLFAETLLKVKNIHKGVSYRDIAKGLDMTEQQAVIVQAVGKAFGLWTLVPVDLESKEMQEVMIKSDTAGMMPMNSGLNMRGVVPPKQGVSVEAKVEINGKKEGSDGS